MKKRLLTLFLAVCLSLTLVLLTSCKREPTATELLQKATLKTAALESYSAVMDMKINMNMLGISMDIPMTVDMKVKNNPLNPTVFAKYDMSMLGQNILMDLYLEDGWMYMSLAQTDYSEAQNFKTNTAEILSEYDFTSDLKNVMKDLPEDLLTDVVPVKNEDGSRTVSLTIPDEVFKEVYAAMISKIGETGGAVGDISTEDATIEVTVLENGYYSSYNMEYTMNINVSGIETSCLVSVGIKFDDPGTPVEITPPEGYKDFPELEE